jgi:hypothetical protein
VISRRNLLQLLPLSLLLGGSLKQRNALADETPEEVVKRVFAIAQRGDWSQLVASMSSDEIVRVRKSLEATSDECDRASIEQAMDAIPNEPQPMGELRGLLDELSALVDAFEDEQPSESVEDDESLAAARKVLNAAGMPRSPVMSDSDFLIAYLHGFQPFLDKLGENELFILGSIRADSDRVHVVYRLSGLALWARPSVMTLTYSDLGWCAAGGDQLSAVATLAAAMQSMPTVEVRVLGELVEAGFVHLLCEADCAVQSECFRPAFCCTWLSTDAELEQIRSHGSQSLRRRLQHDIEVACKGAIERSAQKS